MSQERARFSAEVHVTDATATYADGHTVIYGPDDVQTLGFRPTDRPNFITPLEMVKYSFQQRGIGLLQAVPSETLAAAAKFGQAVVKAALNVTVEDHPENLARETHHKLIVSLKVGYSITVRRVHDA